VSIGYFQPLAAFADLPGPIVRRPTGGGAIHHAEEITFALALDAERLPREVAASYELLHDAVAAALQAVGVPVVRLVRGAAPCAHRSANERWCFAAAGRHDLVAADGRKLVGSAQRRLRRPRERILHHGSIVLRAAPLTPFTAAVADFARPELVAPQLRRELAEAIGRALGLLPVPGTHTRAEEQFADRLARARRAAPSFVQAR
jgi:lipoate-protein ligase A